MSSMPVLFNGSFATTCKWALTGFDVFHRSKTATIGCTGAWLSIQTVLMRDATPGNWRHALACQCASSKRTNDDRSFRFEFKTRKATDFGYLNPSIPEMIRYAAGGTYPCAASAPPPKKWASIWRAKYWRARKSAKLSRFSLTNIV